MENHGRKNSELYARIKQKEQELEDNKARVEKLNEYIKYVEIQKYLKVIINNQ